MTLDKRKKEILLSAQKLFQENGLSKITVEDIAKSIGKGKSSLYYYFKNKEEIFSAVLEMEINEIIVETIRNISKENTFHDKLKAFALTKSEMSKKRKSLYLLTEMGLKADEILSYKQLKKVIHFQYLHKEQIILRQIWEEAIASGNIDILDNDTIETKILLFLCSLRGINREMNLSESYDTTQLLISNLCQLISLK